MLALLYNPQWPANALIPWIVLDTKGPSSVGP